MQLKSINVCQSCSSWRRCSHVHV